MIGRQNAAYGRASPALKERAKGEASEGTKPDVANVVAVGGTEAMTAGDALRLSACAACDANMLAAAAHEIATAIAAEARAGFLNALVLFMDLEMKG